MNKTVRILSGVSVFLIAAAFVLGRVGVKSGAGFVPVADPTELMFSGAEEPGAIWMGLAMIALLAGLSTTLATIRCWLQNRSEMKGPSRHATEIIPR
jgi:hypothetical protein